MSEATLLASINDPALERAVEQLEGWAMERVPLAELADAVSTRGGVRAVVLESDDPGLLRGVIERAHDGHDAAVEHLARADKLHCAVVRASQMAFGAV